MSEPKDQKERLADDMVEIFRAMCTGEGLEGVFAKWLRRIPIDPGHERPTAAELVQRVGSSVVFRTPERASYVAGLFAALYSKTWGEFRSRIPADEWDWLAKRLEEIPAPDDLFDEAAVPGFSDGEWPPCSYQEVKAVVLAFLSVLPPAPGMHR
jgi:hypothetical protein